jgi:Zn-dependent protease
VVADKLGDTTARKLGRLTLNPIKHLDPVGSASFLVTYLLFSFPFGWAKPVPVYPQNLRLDPRYGMALVAIAGPVTNFLIALAVVAFAVHGPAGMLSGETAQQLIGLSFSVNVVLGVFNLLPVPPLDGSRVIGAFMSRQTYEDWSSLDRFAPIMFLLLFFVFQVPTLSFIRSGSAFVEQVLVTIVGG